MALDRAQKDEIINTMREDFAEAKSMVVIHYKGLTVADLTDLRSKARDGGVTVQVTKNSLTKRALENTPYAELGSMFTGPTAVAYSNSDEVAAAKAVVTFGKDNEILQIVGGAIGNDILDETGVKSVASMPSLDESRAKIVGLLTASAAKLALLVQTPAGQVARVIGAKPEGTSEASDAGKATEEASEE